MAVPYRISTLVTAFVVIADTHRRLPVVGALHSRFENAQTARRKRNLPAAACVSRKTLYNYMSQIKAHLDTLGVLQVDETNAFELSAALIAADPRSANKYFSGVPDYQFQELIAFISERHLIDVRALAGKQAANRPDELYYQLHEFIGREPPQDIGEVHGFYYAYRPSLSAPPKILKSLVQIERRPSGAIGYLEKMYYDTEDHGSRRQTLDGFLMNTGTDIFVITRDTNTGFIQTAYLDLDFRDTQDPARTLIKRMKGRYNGITFNAAHERVFSTGIILEIADDQPALRKIDLRECNAADLPGIGLFDPYRLPRPIISRLERLGYKRFKDQEQHEF